jgi:hypothetical protein
MLIRPAYMLLLALSFVRCAAPCENEGSLKELARESVSSQLKAPASAKFSEEEVNPSKDGKGLLVEGVVDAQNQFGAMIREVYLVRVKCNDGQPFVAYAMLYPPYVDEGWIEAKNSVNRIALYDTWGTEHKALMDSLDAQSKASRAQFDARMDSILSDAGIDSTFGGWD